MGSLVTSPKALGPSRPALPQWAPQNSSQCTWAPQVTSAGAASGPYLATQLPLAATLSPTLFTSPAPCLLCPWRKTRPRATENSNGQKRTAASPHHPGPPRSAAAGGAGLRQLAGVALGASHSVILHKGKTESQRDDRFAPLPRSFSFPGAF